jgi:hypothetical protein
MKLPPRRAALRAAGHSVDVAALLAARLPADASADAWLQPSLEQFHDPFAMRQMDEAVALIGKTVRDRRRIRIVTDYDVDGTTAVALVAMAAVIRERLWRGRWPAHEGLIVGTLGYLVKHVTGGDRAEVMRKLSELEAKQGEHALALQKEASERALADQRLSAKIQGVSRDIRTIHDLIEDTK